MGKALLLNMRDYTIVGEFENASLAEDAAELPENADFPKHVVDRDDWDLTATDLVKFYNKLPGVTLVKRFENRLVGMKRLLAVLNGEQNDGTDAGDTTNVDSDTEESDMSTKSTKGKKTVKGKKVTAKKPAGEKKPRTRGVKPPMTAQVTKTKKGEAKRWHEKQARGAVWAYVSKKDGVSLGAVVKHLEAELKLKPEKALGVILQLAKWDLIKITE